MISSLGEKSIRFTDPDGRQTYLGGGTWIDSQSGSVKKEEIVYGTEKPVGSIVSDYKKTQDGGNWISSINGISPEDTTYQKTTMRVDNKFDPSKNSNDGAMIISGLAAIALPTSLFLGPSIAGLGAEASILFDTVSINLTTKVTTLGIIANQYFNTEAGRHNAQIILGAFSGIIKGGLDSSRAGKGAGEILQDMFWGGITGAAFGKIFGNPGILGTLLAPAGKSPLE